MDSEPWDMDPLRRSRSIISQSSDASTLTVVPSPASSNEQHFASLGQSPRAFLTPGESPSNTDWSPNTPDTPRWDQSRTHRKWKYPSWKSHVDNGDEELRPLKPMSPEYPPHWKTENSSTRDHYPADWDHLCRTIRGTRKGRKDWAPIVFLLLSIYSTTMSGIWLALPATKHVWGEFSNSSTMFPLLAKSIEVSFATVFIAALGQSLSRRAHDLSSTKGITFAEISMPTWVNQPGTFFAKIGSLWHAALTKLGLASLAATIIVMLYTSASDQLVRPALMLGNPESMRLRGSFTTAFANNKYITDRCQKPTSENLDPSRSASTCISIEHAGQAFHNYMQYLAQWSNTSRPLSSNLAERPKPLGILNENTTVQGSWIEIQEMGITSSAYNRIVNNVTMAFPHAGVFAAAHHPKNNIMQPSDKERLREYSLSASVPSLSVNVVCANVTDNEQNVIVYKLWPSSEHTTLDANTWPDFNISQQPDLIDAPDFEAIFRLGRRYNRTLPVFPQTPKENDTVLARTVNPSDTLHLLAGGQDSSYTMCSLRAFLTPKCSTRYNASYVGGHLESRCEDTKDDFRYEESHPEAPSNLILQQWVDVANEWAMALALPSGINLDFSSNSWLLTQFIPTTDILDPKLPSIAEALAVLAGCTLLVGSLDAPFDHNWDHANLTLPNSEAAHFYAALQSLEYMSGGISPWKRVYYSILGSTVLFNCGCLVYLIKRFFSRDGVFITDFTEPQNAFALAMNSPPSRSLAGACGCGPSKEQFQSRWNIKHDRKHDHYYLSSRPDEKEEDNWNRPGCEQPSVKTSPVVVVSPEM